MLSSVRKQVIRRLVAGATRGELSVPANSSSPEVFGITPVNQSVSGSDMWASTSIASAVTETRITATQWHSVRGFFGSSKKNAADSNKPSEATEDAGASASKEQASATSTSTPGDQNSTTGADTKGEADQAASGDASQSEAASPSLDQLAADLAKKQEEVGKLTDQLKRALAEMENVRARAAREVDAAKKFAVQGLVKSILDVADNLERAATSVPPAALADEGSTDAPAPDAAQMKKLLKGLVEGVNATEKILLNVFKQQGLEQYNPLNEKFDPNLHNALFEMPDPTKEPGTIAAVTKRGYKLHERVIRPADVGVVRAP